MKFKPKTEIVSRNNYMRFDPLYKCYNVIVRSVIEY